MDRGQLAWQNVLFSGGSAFRKRLRQFVFLFALFQRTTQFVSTTMDWNRWNYSFNFTRWLYSLSSLSVVDCLSRKILERWYGKAAYATVVWHNRGYYSHRNFPTITSLGPCRLTIVPHHRSKILCENGVAWGHGFHFSPRPQMFRI